MTKPRKSQPFSMGVGLTKPTKKPNRHIPIRRTKHSTTTTYIVKAHFQTLSTPFEYGKIAAMLRRMPKTVTFTGTIIPGSQRGRTLGFPTANLDITEGQEKVPEHGVYACLATLNQLNKTYKAAMHIGPRPTFNDKGTTIEVHLLNFSDQDLYGQALTITEPIWIRPVGRFANEQALIEEIELDCARVQTIFPS